MAETINLRVRYTEAEFAAAARLFLWRSPALVARCALVAGLLVSLAFVLAALMPSLSGLWLLGGAAWLGALCYSVGYVAPRRRFRADPRHDSEFRWQFTDGGIALSTPQVESNFRWEAFTRAFADERFYVLAFGPAQMVVIPRRAFAAPAQEAAFRALLRRRLDCPFDARRLPDLAPLALDAYTPPPTPPDWR
ncbi:MAG TPA: YcxB family protein [Pyrinomonadaceae bacterium]|jgi:hypothetical protein